MVTKISLKGFEIDKKNRYPYPSGIGLYSECDM